MGTPTTKTEMLLTSEHELVKQYQLLDVENRPSKIYTAPVNARTGDPCLVSEFIYVDDTSTQMLAKKDGYATWDTSFIPDSSFTVTASVGVSKTQLILTIENEMTKQYQELDGQNRPVRIYEAPVTAIQGTPCKVTEYIYQNPTSSVYLGKKEGYTTWDISWVPDSAFTVSA